MRQRFPYNPPVQTFVVYPLPNVRPYIQTHPPPSLQRFTYTGYSGANMPGPNRHSYPPAVWIPQHMWSKHGLQIPQNYTFFPVEGQRRWSETAATEVRTVDDEVRRWSMHPPVTRTHPYLSADRVWAPEWQTAAMGRPHDIHTPAGDGLADALQLLSLRPPSKSIHNPTPTNTTTSHSIYQEEGEWWQLHFNSNSLHPEVAAGVEEPSTPSATTDLPANVAQILDFLWDDEDNVEATEEPSKKLASLKEED